MEAHVAEIIVELSQNVVVIENFAKDEETFMETIEKYYDYIKQGFEHKPLRECPVHFRLFDKEDAYIHSMQLRHFVTNLMMWEPVVRLGMYEHFDASYLVDCRLISAKLIKNYIDQKIILPFREQVGNRKMNTVIHDMIYNLSRISTDWNDVLGLSINIETFMDVAKRNPRFNEIIRTKIPDGMQPTEIENYLDSLMHEQVNILKTEDNFLRPILLSGAGIKEKQLAEFAINGGLRPDLDDHTIPIPINSNFVVGGLNSITNYYLDSLGGRKSVIMNKTVMGKSGHFARMMMLLVTPVQLRKDEHDCQSVHPIEIEIKTDRHLQRLRGRNYRLPHVREYKIMKGDETYLIGKKVLLRSPITCASKRICKACYGQLYYTNIDIESVGGYAGAKITEPLSQMILSSKHLLTTQSEKIEFNSEFYKFFTIIANEITLNTQAEDININDYSMLLIKDNVKMLDQFGENEFNSWTEVFHVKNKKTGEIIEIMEKNQSDLYFSPELQDLIDKEKSGKEYYEIDLAKIEDDERIFVVEIVNNELTKPLKSIMRLLNHSKHEECTTIDAMSQKLLDLLIESKIVSDSVHGEILIRPLIRSTKDVLEVPNFRKYKAIEEYQILTVEGALQRHPSVLISLSFQDLGRQLTNPLTFRKKEGSFIDPFFKERP